MKTGIQQPNMILKKLAATQYVHKNHCEIIWPKWEEAGIWQILIHMLNMINWSPLMRIRYWFYTYWGQRNNQKSTLFQNLIMAMSWISKLLRAKNGRQFVNVIFKCIFLKKKYFFVMRLSSVFAYTYLRHQASMFIPDDNISITFIVCFKYACSIINYGTKLLIHSKLQRLHRWSLEWISNFVPHFVGMWLLIHAVT